MARIMNDTLTELVYPLTLDAYGDIAVTSDYAEQARGAIISALNTVKGERVYRDEYGTASTLFNTDGLLMSIRAASSALRVVTLEYPDVPYSVTGFNADGMVIVNVSYSVNGSNYTEQLRLAI